MAGPDFLPHHLLLRDTVRTEAYRTAISAAVRPGDTVVDLGTGTGILAVFAARAGAKRVVAIELNPDIARLATRIAEAAGVSDVVEVVTGHSSEVGFPDTVDVLISDALGFFGLCGELDEMLAARRRWAPEARLVPEQLTIFLTPVEAPDATRWLDLTGEHPYREVLGPTRPLAFNLPVLMELTPERWLAVPGRAGTVDLRTASSGRVRSAPEFVVTRDGELSGLCGWYRAELGGGATLGSGADTRRPMARTRFFPLEEPVAVRAGDVVRTEVAFGPTVSSWTVTVVRNGDSLRRTEQATLRSNVRWADVGLGDRCPAGLGALAVFGAGDERALEALEAGRIPAPLAEASGLAELPAGLDPVAFAGVVRAEHGDQRKGIFSGP